MKFRAYNHESTYTCGWLLVWNFYRILKFISLMEYYLFHLPVQTNFLVEFSKVSFKHVNFIGFRFGSTFSNLLCCIRIISSLIRMSCSSFLSLIVTDSQVFSKLWSIFLIQFTKCGSACGTKHQSMSQLGVTKNTCRQCWWTPMLY